MAALPLLEAAEPLGERAYVTIRDTITSRLLAPDDAYCYGGQQYAPLLDLDLYGRVSNPPIRGS